MANVNYLFALQIDGVDGISRFGIVSDDLAAVRNFLDEYDHEGDDISLQVLERVSPTESNVLDRYENEAVHRYIDGQLLSEANEPTHRD